jgi:hypothetical protein
MPLFALLSCEEYNKGTEDKSVCVCHRMLMLTDHSAGNSLHLLILQALTHPPD